MGWEQRDVASRCVLRVTNRDVILYLVQFLFYNVQILNSPTRDFVAFFGAVKKRLLGELAWWRLLGFGFWQQCETCSHEHVLYA